MIPDRWESRVLLRGRGSRDLSRRRRRRRRRRRFFRSENQPRSEEMVLRYLLTSRASVREKESRFSSCLPSASYVPRVQALIKLTISYARFICAYLHEEMMDIEARLIFSKFFQYISRAEGEAISLYTVFVCEITSNEITK